MIGRQRRERGAANHRIEPACPHRPRTRRALGHQHLPSAPHPRSAMTAGTAQHAARIDFQRIEKLHRARTADSSADQNRDRSEPAIERAFDLRKASARAPCRGHSSEAFFYRGGRAAQSRPVDRRGPSKGSPWRCAARFATAQQPSGALGPAGGGAPRQVTTATGVALIRDRGTVTSTRAPG